MHKAIFSFLKNPQTPPTYKAVVMLFSSFKKIGLNRSDRVIIALDSPLGSWRRDLDSNYKANRKENREKFTEIDWDKQYKSFQELEENINLSTPFFTVLIDKMEADDIIAVAVKKYQNQECVIISSDSDFEQLTAYPKVKLYSPYNKKYKIVKDPYSSLAKKIRKESTDNLVNPVLNEKEYLIRNRIVNLIQLPEDIEKKISEELDNLDLAKDYDLEKFRFKSLRDKFDSIYESDKVISIRDSFKKKKKIEQQKLI